MSRRAKKSPVPELPPPTCRYGYPWKELEVLLPETQLQELQDWLEGQTMAHCGSDTPGDGSAGHGTVIYPRDMRNFFAGGEPLD